MGGPRAGRGAAPAVAQRLSRTEGETRSAELFDRARRVLVGGVNSPVRAMRSIGRDPLFIARAAGPNDLATRARRRVIKGTRWLLLKNRANVTTRADRVRLRELLAANRALFIVYVLKDDLKQLWRYRYPGAARRFWRAWYRRALASRIPALITFAKNLAARIDGVISHCRYPLHTGLLEGINNKIKVLKRMAYGFRDDAYFFLKIRAAFPGIP